MVEWYTFYPLARDDPLVDHITTGCHCLPPTKSLTVIDTSRSDGIRQLLTSETYYTVCNKNCILIFKFSEYELTKPYHKNILP